MRSLRLTEIQIEELAARGYAVEPGVSLVAMVEACPIRSPARRLAARKA